MATPVNDLQDLLHEDKDFVYEEEIARNPYSFKGWWRYIEAKRHAPSEVRNRLHERSLKFLPGSYKLWFSYLTDRRSQIRGRCITDPGFEVVNNTYERALVFMHKMPRIWVDYCKFLVRQKIGTRTRRTFDRALQALPITQHNRVWAVYLKFVREFGVWETAVRVYRRYLKYDPSHREEYLEYLMGIAHYGEAAQQLAIIVNDDGFTSIKGKSKHRLWMDLCDLISRHPKEVGDSLKVEPIIRSGMRRFTDEVGRLWCSLADYYIRSGAFSRAADIYEEGITTVVTVRDFSMIFDAYAQFEETMLTAKIEMAGGDSDSDSGDASEDSEDDLEADGNDVDLRLARLDHLLSRRPVLLSSVVLRQNPHNVEEWRKRVALFKDDPAKTILTYMEAVKTIDCMKALGRPHTLWLELVKFYESHGDMDNARVILERAINVDYRSVDDLAAVWKAWAEMELRHDNFDAALAVMQRATRPPTGRERALRIRALREQAAAGRGGSDKQADREVAQEEARVPVQERVFRDRSLWALYVDLEESLGSLDTTRAAYEKMLDLRLATPQTILNYAALLEESNFFEESFRVYEKGVSAFNWPHVADIWIAYLTKFVQRYGGSKLERARDLFEQCVENIPWEHVTVVYTLYAQLEEEHGLVRHAMAVLDRGTAALTVPDTSSITGAAAALALGGGDKKLAAMAAMGTAQFGLFCVYLKKAEEYFGVTRTRPIYEKAIEVLPDERAQDMCVRFASMERKLGEVDRARALFAHGSQFGDPRLVVSYWKRWHEFEVAHGNEDTFRDMLRVKRSVQAQFSQANYTAAGMTSTDAPHALSDADVMAQEAAKQGAAGASSDATAAAAASLTAAKEAAGTAAAAASSGKRKAADMAKTDLAALERQAARLKAAVGDSKAKPAEENPEEIDLELDGEDDADDVPGDIRLFQRKVPAGVFGGAAALAEAQERAKQQEAAGGAAAASAGGRAGVGAPLADLDGDSAPSDSNMGALQRFKRRRQE